MNKLNTSDDIYDLLSAPTASAALGTAIETGLLWLLAEMPMDGTGVAQALGIPTKRCHYWLQILCSLGILEESSQGYVPSSLARKAILDVRSQESWRHLALDERERSAGVHDLPVYIHEPGSIWAAQGLTRPLDYVEKMRGDLNRAREFTRMLFEVHQKLGNELAALLDLNGIRRVMDLGGGSGVVSMALLRKSLDLTATIVDIENVCIAGCEIAKENSLSDRMTYYPAEFDKDDFPGEFDLIIQCDVGVFGEKLFRKLWKSLNEGGRLVIVDHFSPAENVLPVSRLEWSFLDSLEDPNFSIPTIPQVRRDLAQAGFQLLPGENVLADKRIVVQAQK